MSVDDQIEEHLTLVGLLALQLPRLRIREVMVNWLLRASSHYLSSVPNARFVATGAEVELAQMNRARSRLRILELWREKDIDADVRRLSMTMLVACSAAAEEISDEMRFQISDLTAQVRWQVA
jgi:hypothetical protein